MTALSMSNTDNRAAYAPANFHDERSQATGASRQYVSLEIGRSSFAIDIMAVREIRAWTGTTKLPNSAHYILGVINLRGDIIPVIDTRQRFGDHQTEPDRSNVVIVVSVDGKLNGLLVDSVSDIIEVSDDDVLAVPQLDAATKQRFLSGLVTIDDEMIALIDLHEITR